MDYFRSNSDKPSIIVAPTAYGKSLLISSIANDLEGRTVVLQPSIELLRQNLHKLVLLGGHASVYSASAGQKEFGKITYATIGSIKKLGSVFKELGYCNVIVDECHLYPIASDSMFGSFIQDLGVKKILGLTATPFRLQAYSTLRRGNYSQLNMLNAGGNVKGAGFWKEIIHVHQIQQIVQDSYWSELLYELYDFDTGQLVYNSTGADFTEDSMRKAYESHSIPGRVANWVNKSLRKSILVFVPTVELAHSLSRDIPGSAVVWGAMPDNERQFTIQQFREGKIRVVINVNVLSVGFDHPEIDAIIIARPTASLAWFYQAVGRGTRISPHKENCIVVDFVGNTEKFGRLEELTVECVHGKWGVFGGNRLLTGVNLAQITPINKSDITTSKICFRFGKYNGKPVESVPISYLKWMLKEFTWDNRKLELRKEIERVINEADAKIETK